MKGLLSLLMLVMVTAGYYLWRPSASPSHTAINQALPPGKDFWQENNDILIYLEAIARIKDQALFIKTGATRQDIIQATLKSYIEKADPYAAYLSANEFRHWQVSQGDRYVGIGMEIEKNKQDQVLCLPYPDSPAEKAGIRAGDRLISIEGMPVQGRSILAIGSIARGQQGTRVKLNIMIRTGKEQQVNVQRSVVATATVILSHLENIAVIKILAFTRDTKAKLEQALSGLNQNQPLIVDLRGNAGGDLPAAIDSAMLFLPGHKTIVSINTQHGIDNYASRNSTVNAVSPLFLWQDEGTASAAEVFIAALTRNQRALSLGKKSFGKGTRQEVFELSDGSALFLTTGFLQTPSGQFFDGAGLDPDYPIGFDTARTADFLAKVKELLSKSK